MKTSEPISPRFYGRRKGRTLRRGMQALLTDMLPIYDLMQCGPWLSNLVNPLARN